jgi:hypothetical protein
MRAAMVQIGVKRKVGRTIMTKRRLIHLLIAFEIVLLIIMISMIGGAN